MNKEIMISVQPKWCEKIASAEKTIEIRKNKPKIEMPFKVYIYCTNTKTIGDFVLCKSEENIKLWGYNTAKGMNKGFAKKEDINLKGKVIGEFICNEIYPIRIFDNGSIQNWNFYNLEKTCVPYDDIVTYIGLDKIGYGWGISDLIIYDKPKDLNEYKLTKAPQSWCYLENDIHSL